MSDIDYKDEAKELIRHLIISIHAETNTSCEFNVSYTEEFLKKFAEKVIKENNLPKEFKQGMSIEDEFKGGC